MSNQDASGGIDPVPLVGTKPAPRAILDFGLHNPYLHFMLSETWAAAASVTVYATSHSAAFVIQLLANMMPLGHAGPFSFLEALLHWGAALGAGGTFVLVTAYQFAVLIRRLMEDFRK